MTDPFKYRIRERVHLEADPERVYGVGTIVDKWLNTFGGKTYAVKWDGWKDCESYLEEFVLEREEE